MDDLEKTSYIFLLINSPLIALFHHPLMPTYEFIVRNWSFPCKLTKIKSDEKKKKKFANHLLFEAVYVYTYIPGKKISTPRAKEQR